MRLVFHGRRAIGRNASRRARLRFRLVHELRRAASSNIARHTIREALHAHARWPVYGAAIEKVRLFDSVKNIWDIWA
jgi:hypothetical protein